MTTVLAVLAGCYGTYCISFCCTVGYTLIKEHVEQKKEKELARKKTYQTFYLKEKKKELENFERKLSSKNIKLEPIQEESYNDEDSLTDEELHISDEELYFHDDEKTLLCSENYIISSKK